MFHKFLHRTSRTRSSFHLHRSRQTPKTLWFGKPFFDNTKRHKNTFWYEKRDRNGCAMVLDDTNYQRQTIPYQLCKQMFNVWWCKGFFFCRLRQWWRDAGLLIKKQHSAKQCAGTMQDEGRITHTRLRDTKPSVTVQGGNQKTNYCENSSWDLRVPSCTRIQHAGVEYGFPRISVTWRNGFCASTFFLSQ